MAIRFITGIPGSGKGMYSMKMAVDELKRTERPILTNLAVRVHPWVRGANRAEIGLRHYLKREYRKDFNVEGRVHLLTDDQVREFYLWRVNEEGKLIRLDPLRDGTGKIVGFPEESFAETVPCVYLIDEAWQFFNAREWGKLDRGVLFYNAQHRKAGDDLWLATQHHSQVDKNLRVLSAEFHECVNHAKRRLGMFKQPGVISVIVTNDAPEKGSSRVTALTRLVSLDWKGLGACYDTCSGAGISGGVGDIGERLKGVPWWVMIVLIGLLLVVAAKLPDFFAGWISKRTAVKVPAVAGVSNAVPSSVNTSIKPVPSRLPGARSEVRPVAAPAVAAAPVAPVRRMTGWTKLGGAFQVLLEDGEIVDSREPGRLAFLCPRYAVIDGQTNWMRLKVDPPVPLYGRSLDHVWAPSVPAAAGIVPGTF
jgi:hypothetical protein